MLEAEMRNICAFGIMSVFLLLGGCATHSATNDEQVDLYLSTLDDKHFVWCKLDLEQCRRDFEEWRRTTRGQMIMEEFEKEDTGQTYNTHQVPNVFRTRFLDEAQLADGMISEQGKREGGAKKFENGARAFLPHDEGEDLIEKGISVAPRMYGPDS
jgi:hypothetical protein